MKQKRLLMISLLLLAVALVYAWGQYPRQQRLAPPAGFSQGRVSPSAATSTSEGGVRLYLLTREGEQFSGFRRDLFSPLYAEKTAEIPPPPAPPPTLAPPPLPPSRPDYPEPGPTLASELARFTFLGLLQKGGERTVFLSSAGEIFLVKPGDSFGARKQFHITDLTADRLTIRQGEGGQPIVISLVEQTPLAPMRSPVGGFQAASRYRPGGGATTFSPYVPPPVEEGQGADDDSDEDEAESGGEDEGGGPGQPPMVIQEMSPGETGQNLPRPLPPSGINSLFQ